MSIIRREADHEHPWLRDLRTGTMDLASFWSRVATHGTPLIEPDPSSPSHRLVTHLWRARPEDRWVVVHTNVDSSAANLLQRLPGTDVMHATYRCRDDLRMGYGFAANLPLTEFDAADTSQWAQLNAYFTAHPPLADPLHVGNVFYGAEAGLPDRERSILTMPNAPHESLLDEREGIARGRVDAHEFTSTILGNSRRVWVYTPPSAHNGESRVGLPLLLAFDGSMSLEQMPAHRVLDNLLADGQIAPTIGVFVDSGTPTMRNVELPCSEAFAQCIEHELLPWLRERFPVASDPTRTFVTGISYGGLAALWLGYRAPHAFGNVIAQAPSLWWGPNHDADVPRNEGRYRGEWLVDAFEHSPRLPLRIWLEVGLLEHPMFMLAPSRRMRALLEAKGYDLTYHEPAGGHESAIWRETLAQALRHMLPRGVTDRS